jgi:fused signal recognition particle receptor
MLKFLNPFAKKTPEASAQLNTGLKKTRGRFGATLANLFLGKKELDTELFKTLETQLLAADIGIDVTKELLKSVTENLARKEIKKETAVIDTLKQSMIELLAPCEKALEIPESEKPFVILMVGINGAGKTTTIGKMANQLKSNGYKIILAAGDTFRAAAVEQLQTWGTRNDIPVISQGSGADSASVAFDALDSAIAKKMDILIADTAGRLHTSDSLMKELQKIIRVLKKKDEHAPHEILLVLDAGTGQNGLKQAMEFHKSLGVTGLCITKLDGTAKGGIIFAIAKALKLPIRFIGLGERIDDLQTFSAESFVEALFE